MKSFFGGLLAAALNAAVNGAASASNAGAPLKTVGVAAGATAIAGVLGYVLAHPVTQHPAVAAAVVALAPAATIPA